MNKQTRRARRVLNAIDFLLVDGTSQHFVRSVVHPLNVSVDVGNTTACGKLAHSQRWYVSIESWGQKARPLSERMVHGTYITECTG